MAEPALRLERLAKSYGALTVTDDVSLDVAPGELHAIIGPNGAGKTTLIGQVAGLLRSDSGSVRLAGEDVTRLSPEARARRGLARTFQVTSLVPGFTARDNVALAVQGRLRSTFAMLGRAAGDRALEGPAEAALARVGLGARADAPAGSLSHGEKRALELAMALAAEPKLMLLDEPLAGAGPEETERLVALLSSLKGERAIVLVEHDMSAVFALADRVSVLVAGRLVASGPPDAVRGDREVRRAYLGEEAA